MKVNGKIFSGPNVETFYIVRGEETFEFKAQAVLDDSEFLSLCPEPVPPYAFQKGKGRVPDLRHPVYKDQIQKWGELKSAWTILKSLSATEKLEWETVSLDKPETWKNWEKELRSSGFSPAELNKFIDAVMTANGLNEAKLEMARERFLAGKEARLDESSSPKDDQPSMQSLEHVNGSV